MSYMERPECPRGLIEVELTDMCHEGAYWHLLAFCVPDAVVGETPSVVYVYSFGTEWGKLPWYALPIDFQETVIREVVEEHENTGKPWTPDRWEECA